MLFYTGAIKPGAVQADPNKSNGGWISSSQVSNGTLNNIFGDLDYTEISDDKKEIRIIAFQNITGQIIEQLRLWTITEENSFAKIKIGYALATYDPTCASYYFEQIPNQYSTPIYTTVEDAETVNNAILITNVPINQYIGIFLQRNVIIENNSDSSSTIKTCDDWYNQYVANQNSDVESIKKEDNIHLFISSENSATNITPVVTFTQPIAMQVGDPDQTLIGSTTNPNVSIIFTSLDTSKATIINNKLHVVSPGTVIIKATSPASNGYNEAHQDRTVTLTSSNNLFWGYSSTPIIPDNTIVNQTFQFQDARNLSSYNLDFTIQSNAKYLVIKEYISAPIKTLWNNTEFNEGSIPDQVFYAYLEVDQYRYYISRDIVYLNSQNFTITFS